jgi:hypothetical protein
VRCESIRAFGPTRCATPHARMPDSSAFVGSEVGGSQGWGECASAIRALTALGVERLASPSVV